MSAVLSTPKTTSGGEIITNLINASDGAGLHFDGTSGKVGFTPTNLGTKFSFEFIIQAHQWPDSGRTDYIIDFGNGSDARNILGNPNTGYLSLSTGNGGWNSFGVKVLDDLKVHHLVVTVDGTSAIAYDNGNQVGTVTVPLADIDDCTSAHLCANYVGTGSWLNATLYRARLWNKTLSSADVTSVYESASIDFADQWGSQTSKILNGTAWTGATGGTPPTSWTLAGGSGGLATFTIDGSSGSGAEPALKIARASGGTNPYIYQTFTAIIGKQYRVTYRAKKGTADAKVGIGNTAANVQYNATNYTSTDWTSFDQTFTATTTVFSVYVQALTSTGTEFAYFDSVKVEQVGAVADFDLAYANVTQSTIVQNRSGSGDGTAAGGVTQISPIEQLNSKALSVGTVASSPADGSIVASGLVGVADSTYSASLYANYTGGIAGVNINAASNGFAIWDNTVERFKIDNTGAVIINNAGGDAQIYLGGTSGTSRMYLSRGGVNAALWNVDAGSLRFGTNDVERLVIDSAGNAGLGVVPVVTNPTQTSLQIGGNANLSSTKAQAASGELDIFQNAYYAADGNRKYISTDEASMIRQGGGQFVFRNAPSGTAGNTATFTDRLRISSTGAITTTLAAGSGQALTVTGGNNAVGNICALFQSIDNTHNVNVRNNGQLHTSGGIVFDGQTDATGTGITSGASTLNHYEEGTWTPVLGGTTATIPAANVLGIYTRIGNLVFVDWYSGSMTLASSSGSAVISGLPFPVSNLESSYSPFSYTHGNAVDGNSRGGFFWKNTSSMTFIDDGSVNNSTWVDGSNKYVMVSGVYQVA